MSEFEKLHPSLQHHIVNSLGWNGLRPLQEATIEPVLNGENAILLAPTAGGKTEAASFPVLSRMLCENWTGLSVLYICPIKALLNNLEERLSYYGHLLGRTVATWHGDIGPSGKAKIVAEPPDILLTTPESLEVMLVSSRIDHRYLFADVRTVIIDEVHAFAGDDRGWHLLSVLERIGHIAGRELQRLGLSATVGNPQELCDWLAGSCQARRSVINPPAESNVVPDVQVDWVGSLRNAAIVISRLHRGEKRLVFCDSRSRVEELAMELRGLGISTYVSHSCLSLTERRAAEEAFSQGSDCVIVATSTLELGIDVGDLDRVIQIDSPFTVSSFLQRIGRTGRRAGTSRNCLFLVTKEDAFLRALALLQLWQSDFVEPVTPPAAPLHIFSQQFMALALQEGGVAASDWKSWVGNMTGFATLKEKQLDDAVRYMVSNEILHSDSGLLGIGRSGEKAFGQKNFMELFSVFTSPPMVKVFHGKQELGEVHQITFTIKDEGPAVITLGGRSWQTKYVDWPRKKAYVEPTENRGRSQWLSAGQPMHFQMCQAIAEVLDGTSTPEGLSTRAESLLEDLREEFGWVETGKTALLYDDDGNAVWWTFAGKLFNASMAESLAGEADKVATDNLGISFTRVYDVKALLTKIRKVLEGSKDQVMLSLEEDFIQELKFSECLSQANIDWELAERYRVEDVFDELARKVVGVLKSSFD
ncbi:DEAD/DEAH box helicase [Endozoicomonas sp. 4G]|uniref:DEAD/DEAH box helicase n=1 Tax=Endozoicomonas sp. 4G TaxID=2872754 RepID=UPI0020786F3C|nr:DEAD/DEAH box helicase [Endozoicomonas sp. 4G]